MVACGKMEKVWVELKKIEAEAEQIRVGAQQKAQSIRALANRDSEKLISNGQTYGEEEAQRLYASAVEEANRNRDESLKANELATEKLKVQAGKHMDAAIAEVVNSIIKET